MAFMTQGKLKSLESVSNKRGIISAAAMDQRGSLRKSIAKAKGVSEQEISREEIQDFKTEVTKALTPHASAILLDPEYGLPAARARAKGSGLLLAYEVTGYDHKIGGRMPALIPGYSVKKLKEDGGDCVKLLLYWTPYEDAGINEKKKELVRKVGDECAREDIAFFLEPVGYDPKNDVKDVNFARKKPEIVISTIKEFSKDEYGVDVLKLEVPIEMKFTAGTRAFKGEKAYDTEEAKKLFRQAAQASPKPFIYLSAGVSQDEFCESLELAAAAGTDYSGVLCGRATWQDGVPVFAKGGRKALAEWLEKDGVKNIQQLNKVLDKGAKPWWVKYGGREKIQVAQAR